MAFIVVVLPQAVPPHKKKLRPYCKHIHKYAAIPELSVPHFMSCVTLIGVSVNRLMVILGPFMLIALL